MPPYSLGDVLRTTAKTANATAVWKAYHDDPERRPLDKHSQCYEENCGFPPKDTKAVTGTPVAPDEGGGSLVVVAMRTTTRRWPYAAACLLFALLTTTLVLSAVTLGRVADHKTRDDTDCAEYTAEEHARALLLQLQNACNSNPHSNVCDRITTPTVLRDGGVGNLRSGSTRKLIEFPALPTYHERVLETIGMNCIREAPSASLKKSLQTAYTTCSVW